MLRPIGTLFHADGSGGLPRIGSRPPDPWLIAAHQLAEQYKAMLGDNLISAALRGSVARNTMVKDVSDIDLVLVTESHVDDLAKVAAAALPDLHIDLLTMTHADLMLAPTARWIRFTLAFSGYTVFGQDLIAALPDPTLGPHAIAHLHGVARWAAWQPIFDAATDDVDRKRVCQWLMKRIIRSLFESVMLDLRAYTRDIYPCTKAAADAYPAHSAAIWQATELAVAPTPDIMVFAEVAALLIPLVREQAAKLHPPTAQPPHTP